MGLQDVRANMVEPHTARQRNIPDKINGLTNHKYVFTARLDNLIANNKPNSKPKCFLFLLIVPRQQIWATSLFFLVICTTIQLYTNWRWRTHMRHHEPQSNDCLSQQVLGTGTGTQKQPWKITSFADTFHMFSLIMGIAGLLTLFASEL